MYIFIIWASLIGQLVKKIRLQYWRHWFISWVGKIPWRRDRLHTPAFLGFPCGSVGKESAHNLGDLGLIPGLGRFPWRRERLPTPVFWPGEFHGLYGPWGCKESDTTERPSLTQIYYIFKIYARCIITYYIKYIIAYYMYNYILYIYNYIYMYICTLVSYTHTHTCWLAIAA